MGIRVGTLAKPVDRGVLMGIHVGAAALAIRRPQSARHATAALITAAATAISLPAAMGIGTACDWGRFRLQSAILLHAGSAQPPVLVLALLFRLVAFRRIVTDNPHALGSIVLVAARRLARRSVTSSCCRMAPGCLAEDVLADCTVGAPTTMGRVVLDALHDAAAKLALACSVATSLGPTAWASTLSVKRHALLHWVLLDALHGSIAPPQLLALSVAAALLGPRPRPAALITHRCAPEVRESVHHAS